MLSNIVALRAGINEAEWTAGLGIKMGDWGLDYAFGFNDAARGIDDLGGSHRVGFHVNFGKKVSDLAMSERWQKTGQMYLAALKNKMDDSNAATPEETARLLEGTQQLIRRQGYPRPQDLYLAQGYVSYFQGDYERSVQSMSAALELDQSDPAVACHIDMARAKMTLEQTQKFIADEKKGMKELYDRGDYRGALKSCDKILGYAPGDVEANAYREDALNHINEPINREFKIAKANFDKGNYLDTITSAQKVTEMDPDNKVASDLMKQAIGELEKQARLQTAAKPAAKGIYEIAPDTDKSRDFYGQGLLLYSQGKLKEASVVWAQAVKFDGDNLLAKNAYNRAMAELQEK
jgi:tetratricopeptide (TPR) repeat protein